MAIRFSFTPEIRVNYSTDVSQSLSVQPFVGYNRYGGASTYDSYWFDSVEFGTFLLFDATYCFAGVGAKISRNFKVHYRHVGFNEDDGLADYFSDWAGNLGGRLTYTFAPLSVSGEAWFGLNNIAGKGWGRATKIRENHFKAIVGYTY